MAQPRIYRMSFGQIYPLYLQKITKKGRQQAELDQVITWLTGYSPAQVQAQIAAQVDLYTFFAEAPAFNPKAKLITGKICGVQVETIAEPLMQQIRYLDKLVDELARGRAMAKILRT
ncbi:DUF2200 domain-containing protein [Lapidilactobacillus achengensis]|uniref:DUF2200 domain-containing protein n=1 Tax=Lapidilactobacillus achengensis TaxID=2486000 RepID=A0ABW1UQ87_9LACO|nr:DUF2200 domain-containing protein [Lapidilactobacillus achengensis]